MSYTVAQTSRIEEIAVLTIRMGKCRLAGRWQTAARTAVEKMQADDTNPFLC